LSGKLHDLQIILVDSGSTDETASTTWGPKYYNLFGTVNFLKNELHYQKMQSAKRMGFILDADEFVTEAL
jgi:hypothetical protein